MRKLRSMAWAIAAAAMIAAGCDDGVAPVDDDDEGSEQGGAELPAAAVQQIEALLAEKDSRTFAQRKISSQLIYLASGRFDQATAEKKDPAEQVVSLTERDALDRVLVDIKFEGGALAGRIADLGGSVVGSSDLHRSIRAWMPIDQIEKLAEEDALISIRSALQATTALAARPYGGAKYRLGTRAEQVARAQEIREQLKSNPIRKSVGGSATNVGSVNSEGSAAHGAERARKFFAVDGTGVSIGVLSDSDDFKEDSIASGDLPTDTFTVPGQDGRPGIGEGTAMMEIVHDVAPGAKIFFATAVLSPEGFAENIRRLRFEFGCDIIVDDIIYFFESPYQDDIIAQAVADVVADGAMYFSSAGNEGNFNDGTSGVWEGDFKSGGALSTLPSGYQVHDFGNGVISNRVEVTGGPLLLHWSDPGSLDNPLAFNDYDLFVLDSALREVVVASTDVQDGAGLPLEFLGFLIPPDFRIVVAKHPSAEKRTIRALHFRGEVGISTSGATYGHSQAAGAFAVAAVDVFHAEGGEFVGGPTTPVETFSADGPRRVFYDRNGLPLGGGVSGNGGQLRKKPDLAAADGVSTSVPIPGLDVFFGTSAAAPHAAAIAGLLKSAVPTATPNQIRAALLNNSLDIEATGLDRDSGRGLVSAFDGLLGAGARPAAFLELVEFDAAPIEGDVILPGRSAVVSVTIANDGGATAGTVRGTLSSSSPFVTVTSGLVSFPSLGPGASGSGAAPFSFDVSNDAPCGVALPLTLSITFSGRGKSPTVFDFGVVTGRPSLGTATFSYEGAPVEIPDNNPAGVNVPLSVSGIGGLSNLRFHIDGATCTTATGSTTVGVDHTWVGDLVFKLTSPSGTSVGVIGQAGGPGNNGNNFCQTVLDDAAPSSIDDVLISQAPFTGTFGPSNPQAAFAGESADGTWTLNVSDVAGADTGSVRAFSIEVSGFDCTAGD